MDAPPSDDGKWQLDPVFVNARREARFILGLWVGCLLYTVTWCYLNGYLVHEPLASIAGPNVTVVAGPLESFNRAPDSVTYPLGLGIPDWVFYGVAVPWLICIVASFWYGLFFFAEDDLSDGLGVGRTASP